MFWKIGLNSVYYAISFSVLQVRDLKYCCQEIDSIHETLCLNAKKRH
jgi:hypothetical protein